MKIEELEDLYDELIKESNSHLEPDLPTKIYHYTTIEALFNGLLTKKGEDGKICLRATNAIYLNDPEDIKIGMEYLHKILGTGVSLSDFETLTKNCANTYVTSFSAKKDHLPMWHMYARNAKGLSLGFNTKLLTKQRKGAFVKCIYKYKKLKSILDKFDDFKFNNKSMRGVVTLIGAVKTYEKQKNNKQDKKLGFEDLYKEMFPILRYAFSLKNESYEYEDEIRLLYKLEEDDAIEFYLKDNYIIPYIKQEFSKELLEEIIVGPNNDMERTIYSIKTYLKHIGFEHVKVIPSNVPYRG